MSHWSADSPSSSLTVEIASQSFRSIDFFCRLIGAIRPDGQLFICHVRCRGCYAMLIYDNIVDYVITSRRQLLQISYSL